MSGEEVSMTISRLAESSSSTTCSSSRYYMSKIFYAQNCVWYRRPTRWRQLQQEPKNTIKRMQMSMDYVFTPPYQPVFLGSATSSCLSVLEFQGARASGAGPDANVRIRELARGRT